MPGLVEVIGDLAVTLSTRPQRQDRVEQLLLVRRQRTNVERDLSAAVDENLRGLSAVVLRQESYRGHSTVAEWICSGVLLHRHGVDLLGG